MEWQPIATLEAKEVDESGYYDQVIFAFDDGCRRLGRLVSQDIAVIEIDLADFNASAYITPRDGYFPTHWMPLPPPPGETWKKAAPLRRQTPNDGTSHAKYAHRRIK